MSDHSLSPVDRAIEQLDRLATHVEAVRSGSHTSRDDLAVVLQILVGNGDGYGQLPKALAHLGIDMSLPGWQSDLPQSIDDMPVVLAIRGSSSGGPQIGLNEFLAEPRLRWANPAQPPEANWSALDLIKKVRNNFGGHADQKPPRWLTSLRYFPAGEADMVTFLMWTIAQDVLTAATTALADAGCAVSRYQPEDRYLNGMEFNQGIISGHAGELDVRVHLRCERWASGHRRAILGGFFEDQPFIFGLEPDGSLSTQTGPRGGTVAEALETFRTGFSQPGAPPQNRAARRAAARKRSK